MICCFTAGIVTTIQEDLRDQKMEIPDIKQDIWKRFLGLECHTGGEEFYISLLMQICNNKLSMHEAGEQATCFKLQALCQKDICKKLGVETWAEAESVFVKHCTREAIEPLLVHYTKTKRGSGVPPAVTRHCNAALAWKDGNDREEDPRMKVFTGPTSGHYDYNIEGIMPSEDKRMRQYFKVIHADMTKLASSGLVPKLKYRFVLLDVWYEFHTSVAENPEAMDAKTFGSVLDQVLALSTSPLVTIIVFMSHLQKCGFETEMKRACNAGVELAYWSKVQTNNLPGPRITNIVEEMLIGYHNNAPSSPNTYRVPEFFRYVKGEPRTNVFECHKVTKHFKKATGTSKPLNVDQKPMALYEKLFYTLNDSKEDIVLDLGCGTAAASAAALNRGMSAIAVDNDKLQVRGAFERLANKNILPDADEERNVIRGRFVPGGTYKGKKKKADNDEDEDEDEAGDEDEDDDDGDIQDYKTKTPDPRITPLRKDPTAETPAGAGGAAAAAADGADEGAAAEDGAGVERAGAEDGAGGAEDGAAAAGVDDGAEEGRASGVPEVEPDVAPVAGDINVSGEDSAEVEIPGKGTGRADGEVEEMTGMTGPGGAKGQGTAEQDGAVVVEGLEKQAAPPPASPSRPAKRGRGRANSPLEDMMVSSPEHTPQKKSRTAGGGVGRGGGRRNNR